MLEVFWLLEGLLASCEMLRFAQHDRPGGDAYGSRDKDVAPTFNGERDKNFDIALKTTRSAVFGYTATNQARRTMKKQIVVGMLAVMTLVQGCGYNRLVSLQQEVEKQWAQVQNVYQRRADLIPNLVATVSGSANLAGSFATWLASIFPTDARASVIATSVDFSKFAAPDTVATRFGTRSARR